MGTTIRLNMSFSHISLICFNYRWHQKYRFLIKCNEPLNSVTYPWVFVDKYRSVGVCICVYIAPLHKHQFKSSNIKCTKKINKLSRKLSTIVYMVGMCTCL